MDLISIINPKSAIKNSIIELPVGCIKPNPYQPRRLFNNDSIRELCNSIKQYGVIQPITVRKISLNSYELVTGERRLRACIEAKIEKIPAIIVDFNDNDSAVVALVENLQRENLSFLEEAQAFHHLIYEHGLTQEELAVKIGKKQSTVANKMRLLKLTKLVKNVIEDNKLSERHARALLKIPDECVQLSILETVCENDLNVRETEEIVQKKIKEILEEEKKKKCEITVLKDVRIFINTIERAISVMKKSGIDADVVQSENDDEYEYLIKIPKKEKNIKQDMENVV